jgi:hypothetical protein
MTGKITIEQKWHQQSEAAKNEAEKLPQGREREALARKARQLHTASQINEWIARATAAEVGTLSVSSASAAMMSCASENMAKSVAAGDAMQESPVKRAMLKELADANTAMSNGNMRAACKSYMRAQK